ncbi:MAG: stage V sporulation protein AC [Oscillospiraceae bacterium]|nr:stage V sporulation protein AC [Oscillospiraceae bacterium]
MVNMTNQEYRKYVALRCPPSPLGRDMFRAFVSGGLICALGQGILTLWGLAGLEEESAAGATSVTLIFLGVLLTGLGVYDRLAKFCGAGTLVPITGFANSIASPALEFKSEGLVAGMAAKMFVIAGPVLVYGLSASVIYGLVLVLLGSFG